MSGATYTSEGYVKALQAVLDAAHPLTRSTGSAEERAGRKKPAIEAVRDFVSSGTAA